MKRLYNSQNSLFFENYDRTDDWQCHYIRGNALVYVVLRKAGKNLPYGELVGTTEHKTL